jgi:hypothetical protein
MQNFLSILHSRFLANPHRHPHTQWEDVERRLEESPEKLGIIERMETTGGEPDIVEIGEGSDIYYVDCSSESPAGRRSLCYDRVALDARKENKPKNSVEDMAREIGIEVLSEEEYKKLQSRDKFDTKTSSWIATPETLRKL